MDELHLKDFTELSFSDQWQESFKLPMKKLVKALTVRIVDWNTWFNVQADATHIFVGAILLKLEREIKAIHITAYTHN